MWLLWWAWTDGGPNFVGVFDSEKEAVRMQTILGKHGNASVDYSVVYVENLTRKGV